MSPEGQPISLWRRPTPPARPAAYEPAPTPPPAPAGSEMRRLASMVRRRGLLIAAVALLVLGLVAIATALWPRTYESNTTVLVHRPGGEGTEIPGLAILQSVDRAQTIETESELIASRRVAT